VADPAGPAALEGELGPGLRLTWEPDAGTGRPWRLDGELDWGAVDSLRVVSATLDDGTVLGAAALRPAEASDHGGDLVAATILRPDAEPEPIEEALLSTEYGPDGAPRRLGLELWPPADGVPVRVAADVGGGDGPDGALALTVRSGGHTGTGSLHIVRGNERG
jgi:hypothetical protein